MGVGGVGDCYYDGNVKCRRDLSDVKSPSLGSSARINFKILRLCKQE